MCEREKERERAHLPCEHNLGSVFELNQLCHAARRVQLFKKVVGHLLPFALREFIDIVHDHDAVHPSKDVCCACELIQELHVDSVDFIVCREEPGELHAIVLMDVPVTPRPEVELPLHLPSATTRSHDVQNSNKLSFLFVSLAENGLQIDDMANALGPAFGFKTVRGLSFVLLMLFSYRAFLYTER